LWRHKGLQSIFQKTIFQNLSAFQSKCSWKEKVLRLKKITFYHSTVLPFFRDAVSKLSIVGGSVEFFGITTLTVDFIVYSVYPKTSRKFWKKTAWKNTAHCMFLRERNWKEKWIFKERYLENQPCVVVPLSLKPNYGSKKKKPAAKICVLSILHNVFLSEMKRYKWFCEPAIY
jgi:hypothetical protein